MKVAVIIDTWFPFIGGGQINAWEISRRLARKGIKIDIVTRNNGQDKLKKVKNLKIFKLGSRSVPEDSLSKLFFLIRSFLFIQKRNHHLVHAHAFLPGITARLLMVFKGVPAVFTVHGSSINTKLNNFFSRWLEKFILTQIRYSAQITVSHDFLKLKNINRKIFYIPNGVNVADFGKIKIQKFKDPTLIFVGRLHPQKNLKTLIMAINYVKEKIPNVRLLIVGKGNQKKELMKLVQRLALKNKVEFLGQKIGRDLIKLYKSSHLFVLPSVYEGQPLTLLEAWAAKLPVVVSKTGDCQYLVKNGINGYLIEDQSNPNNIAKFIMVALKNKDLEKIDQNSYNLVKEKFNWQESAHLTLDVYEKISSS